MYESYEEYERAQFAKFLDSRRPPFFFEGACNEAGLETFFPGQGKSSLVKKALSICDGCHVKRECFDYSYEEKIEFGIWGGATPDQRRQWLGLHLTAKEAWEESRKD